jgi:hypothetical protein
MKDARFMTMAELRNEDLFLPFELSIKELARQLANSRSENIDGGPGSGRKSEGEKEVDYMAAREYSKDIKGVVTVNGTEMKKVSGHAAFRMKERNLSVNDVKEALTKAEITYPGNKKHPNAECYQHKDSRIVVSPSGVIITVIDLEDDD